MLADERYATFLDGGTNLITGLVKNDGTAEDVYVRDLVAGTTTLVSVNQGGTGTGNAGAGLAMIAGGGRFVAFTSDASDLVPHDTNKSTDVFVRDLQKGTTTLVSIDRFGSASGDGASGLVNYVGQIAISPDGRYVTFASVADDLTADNLNRASGLFERDLASATTTLVSVNKDGTGGSINYNLEYVFSMTPDGRYVAFESDANDLSALKPSGAMLDDTSEISRRQDDEPQPA